MAGTMEIADTNKIATHCRNSEFPRPRFPLFPVVSAGTFFGSRGRRPLSVLEAGSILRVTTGRMGLSLALEHMHIKAGEKVLIPAYHCNSMVEPVVNAGAIPVFYMIGEGASVDLDDVRKRMDNTTRVLMVTHYFGFPQNLVEIRKFCNENALVLIEDCAHVFYGEVAGKPLGSYGDYAFVSPMKFFPSYDGGFLVSSKHAVNRIPLKSAGWMFSVKGAYTILDRSITHKRFRLLAPVLALLAFLRRSVHSIVRAESPVAPADEAEYVPRYDFAGYFSGLPGEFDPAWIHTRMSLTSQVLIRLASQSRIVRKRRENYLALQDALSDLPGCNPFYPILPEKVVPYVFPLLVDEPRRVFPALKRLGVPISRFGEYLWRDFSPSQCPTAIRFSRGVLQFPCHQEMTRNELTWMIQTIRNVMRERH